MARFLLTVAVTALCGMTARSDDKDDLARFQGTWVVARAVRNGAEAPDIVRDALRVTVKGATLIIRSADDVPTVIQAEMTLDRSKTPPQIVLTQERSGKRQKLYGIYELDGDTLRLCWTTDGGARPAAFAAPAGSKAVYFELKKATK